MLTHITNISFNRLFIKSRVHSHNKIFEGTVRTYTNGSRYWGIRIYTYNHTYIHTWLTSKLPITYDFSADLKGHYCFIHRGFTYSVLSNWLTYWLGGMAFSNTQKRILHNLHNPNKIRYTHNFGNNFKRAVDIYKFYLCTYFYASDVSTLIVYRSPYWKTVRESERNYLNWSELANNTYTQLKTCTMFMRQTCRPDNTKKWVSR